MVKVLSENEKNSKVITLENSMGGCGKSCVCNELTNYALNKNVLIIDLDPQTHSQTDFFKN